MLEQDIDIYTLKSAGFLTTRAFNLCRSNALNTLNGILLFFHKNKSFVLLKGCGGKSEAELLDICATYKADFEAAIAQISEKDKENEPDIFAEDGGLSTEAVHFCYENALTTISKVLLFFYTNDSFKAFIHYAEKVETELITFCQKHKNSLFTEEMLANQADSPLHINGNLSKRTLLMCAENGLHTLKALYSFWNKEIAVAFFNYDKKAKQEIMAACRNYERQMLYAQKNRNIAEGEYHKEVLKCQNLSTYQQSILNNLIEIKVNRLSNRVYSALNEYLVGDFSIINLDKHIFSAQEFKFVKISTIGTAAMTEINAFIAEIISYVKLIHNSVPEKETTHNYQYIFLVNNFKITLQDYAEIAAVFTQMGKMPLFKTFSVLIKKGYLFKENEGAVFLSSFDYFDTYQGNKLKKLGEQLSLTSERARQIRYKLYKDLPQLFCIVKLFEAPMLGYEIDFNQPYIFINNTIVEKINATENVNFNLLFINKILSVIAAETHTLIGNERDRLFHLNNPLAHDWQQTYLISSELTARFDFEKCIEDVAKRLKNKREKHYSLDFQPYLLSFYKEKELKPVAVISDICEKIIFNELSMSLEENGHIAFRNKIKKISDYVIEIFEEVQRPLKMVELLSLLNQKKPDSTVNLFNLRAACNQTKELVPISRTSTYMLKEWEQSKEKLRGGTIRGIAAEYLLQYDTPKPISEIVAYILRFRPTTNYNSVYSNLKAEKTQRFVFFDDDCLGLSAKEYKGWRASEIGDFRLKAWAEGCRTFEAFVRENNRLPSNVKNKKENKLYRFLYGTRQKYNKHELTDEQAAEYKRLTTLIPIKKKGGGAV